MTAGVSHEDLMRYLDGELSPEERVRVEGQISTSTELQRDVAVFRKIKEDFRSISFGGSEGLSVWDRVNRRLTRPVGWVLIVSGSLVCTMYGIYLYAVSAAHIFEKLASAAIVVGVLMLLGSVIYERYRDWLTDPYRELQR